MRASLSKWLIQLYMEYPYENIDYRGFIWINSVGCTSDKFKVSKLVLPAESGEELARLERSKVENIGTY